MVAIVFMVAGMSSRFGGNPKQFAQVGPNNETLIEYSVHQALTQPFSAIYFICNPRTEIEFRKKFGNIYQGRQVHYIYQNYDTIKRKKPWGTIDAIAQLYHQTKSNNNITTNTNIIKYQPKPNLTHTTKTLHLNNNKTNTNTNINRIGTYSVSN